LENLREESGKYVRAYDFLTLAAENNISRVILLFIEK